jgi:uncharacterized membrane protein
MMTALLSIASLTAGVAGVVGSNWGLTALGLFMALIFGIESYWVSPIHVRRLADQRHRQQGADEAV